MRTFGLVGYPLTHSFSQKYFTEKFENLGVSDAEYKNFSIPQIEEVDAMMHHNPYLCGFNITIPYKKKIIPYLHNLSDAVQKMGACNCVQIKDGILTGYNTDVIGFKQSLKPYLKPHHNKALILGTGGAAAAVEYVLNELNIAFHFVSRNATDNVLGYNQLTKEIIEAHTLIINTSPVGQYPAITESPEIPYDFINNSHHLFDLIYNPAETAFLQKGKARGASTQNGYEMLVLQAEESWRIWNS
jgi:shikimate dehydrogenase